MSGAQENVGIPTIGQVVEETTPELTLGQRQQLTRALIAREDTMADMLRMAGMQFGLYPQIVAEVFAEVGVGTPVTAEQRVLIRQQFQTLMIELQRQQGLGG